MSHGTKEDEAKRTSRKAFLQEERALQIEQRISGEAKRKADNSAKTAKLRGLREARDTAEREAAEAEAERVARIKRSVPNLKRAKAAKEPGVRLRKGGK
jgi:hypothetical protein